MSTDGHIDQTNKYAFICSNPIYDERMDNDQSNVFDESNRNDREAKKTKI